jgi:phosphorylase kinase alpha/beta subunit
MLNASRPDRLARLDHYYHQIKATILIRQNPITGLLPASTAITAHGDYTDAWVRDNVFSILAVWGLALAYRKVDQDQGRAYELEHSVIKLMRSLLFAMMRQVSKVEHFKKTQSLTDALHAKYNTFTCDTVVGDDAWGHLQLDATSLYVLMLAQMTTSGLAIIYTLDEVSFVQNLIYYIGRAYRTPDYGIWERGNKTNRGKPELNASSIGTAKAALQAINGLNLFGVQGSQASVIHVLPDEIARTQMTLESLLPRESGSKEIDAALLGVIGFPAFAVEDPDLIERTRHEILHKLQGRYGCKRFLRDGHQTVREDTKRLHYEPAELKQFEHIECEWPLFFTYLLLEGLVRKDPDQVKDYQARLETLLVERDGWQLLPEVYYVPAEAIAAEQTDPHSQSRLPNENVPLLWAQSLYILAQLLQENLVDVGDLDPLGRHLQIGRKRQPTIQIALVAESKALQEELEAHGIPSQALQQIEPIQIRSASELADAFTQVGRNDALGLTGRPKRRLRSLTTSRIFRIQGGIRIFLPSFLDQEQFYLSLDYSCLVAQIQSELAYMARYWQEPGRPTMTLVITQAMWTAGQEALLPLMKDLRDGSCHGIPVKLGPLNQLLLTAGSERIDYLHDFQFSQTPPLQTVAQPHALAADVEKSWPLSHRQEFKLECETDIKLLLTTLRNTCNLYEQIELLQRLALLRGMEFDTGLGGPNSHLTVNTLLDGIYALAGKWQHWAIVRQAAGLLHKIDMRLSDAVTDMLVRQKQISVGKSYSEGSLITQPLSNAEIWDKITQFGSEDVRERVLTQEILIALGQLIQSKPSLFDNLLTLRVGYLILLMTSELAQECHIPHDEAYERLMQLSPSLVQVRLTHVLSEYEGRHQILYQQESLHLKRHQGIHWQPAAETPERQPLDGWLNQRKRNGILNRTPRDFYPTIWGLLRHCKGLVIGDKLDRRNRLDSELILSEMTRQESNFALQVEHLLNKISAPEYRCLTIEALSALALLVHQNPQLQIDDYIVLDVVIGHAVRLAWFDQQSSLELSGGSPLRYDDQKAAAWSAFYQRSSSSCAVYMTRALLFLIELGEAEAA